MARRVVPGAALVLALALGPALGPTARAQEDAAVLPDSALAAAVATIKGQPITLADAQALAAEQATDLGAAQAALDAARAALRSERGAFDPELFTDVERVSDDRLPDSPFSGADVLKSRQTQGTAGARIRLPIGTELEASFSAVRQSTNSAFASLDPQYDASATLRLRQPLLRGFGPAASAQRSAAERRVDAATLGLEETRWAVRAGVEAAYWRLHAAERDYAVQSLILEQGERLLSEAQTRSRVGLVGPVEVANARVFVAEQQQALLDREEDLDAASDALVTLIGRRPAAGQPRFHPSDAPPQQFMVPAIDPLVTEAIERNDGLRANRSELAALRARLRGARWNALPALDVFGSFGANALAGTPREVIFGPDTLLTTVHGSFGDLWTQIGKRTYPAWSAGLSLSLPIGLRQAGGERERQAAELRRAEHEYDGAARSLEEAVRAGQRELDHSVQRLQFAGDGVDASKEQVRIGRIDYIHGRSTAFELVRLGADLAAAQRRYSQALVRAAVAAARLEYLTSGAYPGDGTDSGRNVR